MAQAFADVEEVRVRRSRKPTPLALHLPLWFRKALWSTLFACGGRATSKVARVFAPGIWFAKTEEPRCALTIDDAPGELPLLDELLDLLDECECRATFFVMSGSCETCWDAGALDRIVRKGHELGNHLVEDKSYARSSFEDFIRALDECERLIEECWARCEVPQESRRRWYRPPRGRITSKQRQVLKERGYAIVWGDCFPNDPHNLDEEYIGRFISTNAMPGSIIICHMPEQDFRYQTLGGLRVALPKLRERGLKCVTLNELIKREDAS